MADVRLTVRKAMNISQVEARFWRAEVLLMRKMAPGRSIPCGNIEFPVPERFGGVPEAAYRGTRTGHLENHLRTLQSERHVDFSSVRAAVFGGGIGRSAAALAGFCRKVDVYESAPLFVKTGRDLMDQLGISNVNFLTENYFHINREDISRIRLVYFYNPQPGNLSFMSSMAFTLAKLRPGTLIISCGYIWDGLVKSQFFKPFYPRDPRRFAEAEFPTLVRTRRPNASVGV